MINTTDEFVALPGDRIFYLRKPKPEDVKLVDIAQSLTRKDRYNGYGKIFWSVASHSLLVSEIVQTLYDDTELALDGLLHDAEEAYIGDVIAPVKRALYPYYHELVAPVRAAVRQAFAMESPTLPEQVRRCDEVASYIETCFLFDQDTWTKTWNQKVPEEYRYYAQVSIPVAILDFATLDFGTAKKVFAETVIRMLQKRA